MGVMLGRAAVLAAVVVLLPSVARAELRRVEFKLPGMDCAYCNGAMSTAVKKLDGVEAVELIVEKAAAVIRLKADNTITLQQLRRVIKSVGYDAKDAEITARGRITNAGATFDLLNGTVMRLASPPAGGSDAIVEVTGIAKDASDAETLTIATIK